MSKKEDWKPYIHHFAIAVTSIVASLGALNWLTASQFSNGDVIQQITKGNDAWANALYIMIGLCGVFSLGFQLHWIFGKKSTFWIPSDVLESYAESYLGSGGSKSSNNPFPARSAFGFRFY